MSIFLLNERRSRISEIEEKTDVRIVVVSDPSRSDNRFEVNRIRTDDKKNQGEASYDIQDEVENLTKPELDYKNKKMEKAAVDMSPKRKPKSKGKGFFSKLIETLSGEQEGIEKKGNIKSKPKNKTNNYKKSTKSRNQKQGFKKDQAKKNFNKTKKTDDSKKDNTSKNKNLKKDVKSEKVDLKSKNKPKKPANNQTRPKPKKDVNKTLPKKDVNKTSPKKDVNKPSQKNNEVKKEKGTEKTSLEEKKPIEKPTKAAKDWGRASNDPRNKT